VVLGELRGRIVLDGEAADLAFDGDAIVVRAADPDAPVDVVGEADGAAVLELIDGWLPVEQAILDGRVRVRGSLPGVDRIFAAVEILLDAAPRAPALQELAREFRADPSRPGRGPAPLGGGADGSAEIALLARLDLLPPVDSPSPH
jgi:hypothetical protein